MKNGNVEIVGFNFDKIDYTLSSEAINGYASSELYEMTIGITRLVIPKTINGIPVVKVSFTQNVGLKESFTNGYYFLITDLEEIVADEEVKLVVFSYEGWRPGSHWVNNSSGTIYFKFGMNG